MCMGLHCLCFRIVFGLVKNKIRNILMISVFETKTPKIDSAFLILYLLSLHYYCSLLKLLFIVESKNGLINANYYARIFS